MNSFVLQQYNSFTTEVNQLPMIRNLPPRNEIPERAAVGIKKAIYNVTIGPLALLTGLCFLTLSKLASAINHPIQTAQNLTGKIKVIWDHPKETIKDVGQTLVTTVVSTAANVLQELDEQPIEKTVEFVASSAFLKFIPPLGSQLYKKSQQVIVYKLLQYEFTKQMAVFVDKLKNHSYLSLQSVIKADCQAFVDWYKMNEENIAHYIGSNYIKDLVDEVKKYGLYCNTYDGLISASQSLHSKLFSIANQLLLRRICVILGVAMQSLPLLSPLMIMQGANERNRSIVIKEKEVSLILESSKIEKNLTAEKTANHLLHLLKGGRKGGKRARRKAVGLKQQIELHTELLKKRSS